MIEAYCMTEEEARMSELVGDQYQAQLGCYSKLGAVLNAMVGNLGFGG